MIVKILVYKISNHQYFSACDLYLFIQLVIWTDFNCFCCSKKNAKGLDLMHWVTTQLNIAEKEYFGLLWKDKTGEKVCDCLYQPSLTLRVLLIKTQTYE